jgi:uncharacterized membrane protein YgcG
MCVVLLAAAAPATWGESVAGLPAKPSGYVNDYAGVLSPETVQNLEALCAQVDSKAHAQIAVATIKTIDADKSGATPSIEEFANALYQKWGVGKKGTDRGVLMLLVMSPRHGRIEVGYGLEGILNDAKVGDIGRAMGPYDQRGDYNDGVTLGVGQLAQDIAADAQPDSGRGAGLAGGHREPAAAADRAVPGAAVWRHHPAGDRGADPHRAHRAAVLFPVQHSRRRWRARWWWWGGR